MGHEQQTAARLRPLVKIEAERKVLRVGGVIQSVAVDASYTSDVWDALLPATRPANALILGLGGGTVATLMTRRWGRCPSPEWSATHSSPPSRCGSLAWRS